MSNAKQGEYYSCINLTEISAKISDLRRSLPEVWVTSGQKPCTKIIYIVSQTSVGLF